MSLTIVRDVSNNKNVHLQVDGSNQLSVKDATAQSSLSSIQSAVEGTLAVSVASMPLPSGAATSALQSTGNSSLATIAGAVSGSEIQCDVITAALPSGAATSALQSTGNTSLSTLAGCVDSGGSRVDVNIASDSLSLATAALQTTGNTDLAAIKTALQGTLTVSSAGSTPSRSSGSLASSLSVTNGTFSSSVDVQNQRSVAVYGNSSNSGLEIAVHVSDDNSNFYEAANLAIFASGSSGDFYHKWDQCARYFKIEYKATANVTARYTLLD